jgi:hypothetical protein
MDDIIRSLPKLLRTAGESKELLEAAALVAWRRVAGEGLRSNAVGFRLYQKTLVIAVPDAGWQKQLESISGQLLFRVNSLLGQALVTYLEFRVDPETVEVERRLLREKQMEHADRERRALTAINDDLRKAAKGIKDEELRRRFLLAAGSCIDRRENDQKLKN